MTDHELTDGEIEVTVAEMVGLTLEDYRKGKQVLEMGGEALKESYINGAVTTDEAFVLLAEERKGWADFIESHLLNRTDTHPAWTIDPETGNLTWLRQFAPVTRKVIECHIAGAPIIGAYATDPKTQTSRWGVIDIDAHDAPDLEGKNFERIRAIAERFENEGAAPIIEDSNGQGGFHLWIVFSDPVPKDDLVTWMQAVAGDLGKGLEFYPTTGKVNGGKNPGVQVRIPGQHHKRPDHHSRIWLGDDVWSTDLAASFDLTPTEIVPVTPHEVTEPDGTDAGGGLNGQSPNGSTAALAQYDDKSNETAFLECLGLLKKIDPETVDRYGSGDSPGWLQVGQILHRHSPDEDGLAAWDRWSKRSGKYEPGACREKWATFTHDATKPLLGVGTLRKMARDAAKGGPEAGETGRKTENAEFHPMREAVSFLDHRYRSERGNPLIRRHQETWLQFDGVRYAPITDEDLKILVRQHLEDRYQKPRVVMVNELVEALKAVPGVAVSATPPCWIDGTEGPAPADSVDLKNGVLDVRSGQFIPIDETRFRTAATAYDFDPNAPEPTEFLKFIESSFGGEGQPGVIQEWLGYILTHDTRFQKVLFLKGAPRSGKGTLLTLMGHLLGEDAAVGLSISSFGERFGLTSAIGKKLAVVADARFGNGRAFGYETVARLLSFSSGDLMQCDVKNKGTLSVRHTARLAIASNEWPRFEDGVKALETRFLYIESRGSHVDGEDINLLDRLLPELPGIFAWSIAGLRRLRRREHFPKRETPSGDGGRVDLDLVELRDAVRNKFGGKATVTQIGHEGPNKFRKGPRGHMARLVKAGMARWTVDGGNEIELVE